MAPPPTAPDSPAPATEPAAQGEAGPWRVLPLEGAFEFSYLDAAGQQSLRRVSAVELKVGPGKLLLGGIDAQLEAYRGFRVDRIHALRVAETGEVISRNILDWLMNLAQRQARARTAMRKGRAGAEARAG